jgi:tRNA(His) 5'-end guanylyltransferase
MKFDTLEKKCLYYRNLSDYRLLPNSHVIVMCDGRSFSKLIKNEFQKPFDDEFISMMNETAKYVCENVQCCKLCFVQSDEFSLYLTDFDTPQTESFFDYRLCKLLSIISSLATSKFNQLLTVYYLKKSQKQSLEDSICTISNQKLVQFDCKCWNVPNFNDVFAWFLYRQTDCIRNSKQQTSQTFLSSKKLVKLNTDEQIELLLSEKGIDWHTYSNDKKYGRFIYKQKVLCQNIELNTQYYRNKWIVYPAFQLTDDDGKENFKKIFNNIKK